MFDITEAVYLNALFWKGLYYDEVVKHSHWFGTYCKAANRPYYNAAQNVTRLTPEVLTEIEAFYKARDLPPRIYLQDGDINQEIYLERRGYVHLPDEDENWYALKLHYAKTVPVTKPILTLQGALDPKQAELFTLVDTLTNALTPGLAETLYNKLLQNPELLRVMQVSFEQDNPVACHAWGASGKYAFMAEGGTLPEYRRRGHYQSLVTASIEGAIHAGAKYICVNCDKFAFSNQGCLKLGFKPKGTRFLYELR